MLKYNRGDNMVKLVTVIEMRSCISCNGTGIVEGGNVCGSCDGSGTVRVQTLR